MVKSVLGPHPHTAGNLDELRFGGMRLFLRFVSALMLLLVGVNLYLGEYFYLIEALLFLLSLSAAFAILVRGDYEKALNTGLLGSLLLFLCFTLYRMHWQGGDEAVRLESVFVTTLGVSLLLSGILAERLYQVKLVTGLTGAALLLHVLFSASLTEGLAPAEIGVILVYLFEICIAFTIYHIFGAYRRMQHSSEVLGREISHRVKNDMAITSSLINLEWARTESGEVRRVLETVQERLHGLYRVHDLLHRTDSGTLVDLYSLMRDLVALYRPLLAEEGVRIDLSCGEDELEAPATFAIPVGLILNELLTNSRKYAFEGGEGWIDMCAGVTAGGELEIVYRDSGPGLQDEQAQIQGFGFLMIRSQIERFDGSWLVLPGEGFALRIRLSLPSPEGFSGPPRRSVTSEKNMIA
jgi:two-component sensor histidine kinase